MNVLIVHAHPEPKSFNGAMTDQAERTLSADGHSVRISDLCAMQFKPALDADDVVGPLDADRFEPIASRRAALRRGALAPDLVAEQEKVQWCDLLVFQFPLWWFSLPAILKGWVDRVFVNGFSHGGGDRYETGKLRGRLGLLSMTTGTAPSDFRPGALHGDINECLFAINHGILFYVGLEVLEPFIAWNVHAADEAQRAAMLEDYRERLLRLDDWPRLDLKGPAHFS